MTWQGTLIAEVEAAIVAYRLAGHSPSCHGCDDLCELLADHAPRECRRDALYIAHEVLAELAR
jgi:hypothetical protein